LEDLGVNGKILIFSQRNRGMGWIDVAQKTDRWRALVNTIMNFRVP
jgi:hypothetical protein